MPYTGADTDVNLGTQNLGINTASPIVPLDITADDSNNIINPAGVDTDSVLALFKRIKDAGSGAAIAIVGSNASSGGNGKV